VDKFIKDMRKVSMNKIRPLHEEWSDLSTFEQFLYHAKLSYDRLYFGDKNDFLAGYDSRDEIFEIVNTPFFKDQLSVYFKTRLNFATGYKKLVTRKVEMNGSKNFYFSFILLFLSFVVLKF